MKRISLLMVLLLGLFFIFHPAHAQTVQPDGFVPSERHAADTTSAAQPLILVMNANGTIEPAMQEYFERGIHTAEGRNAEALIIQLDTPGGDLQSMDNIIQDIRASTVPVVVYVAPNSAMAGSAGALITISADVAAMAPEAAIGASSPIEFERPKPRLDSRYQAKRNHEGHHPSTGGTTRGRCDSTGAGYDR